LAFFSTLFLTFAWKEESEDCGLGDWESELDDLDFPLSKYTIPRASTVAIRRSNKGFRSIDGVVVEGL
jgi:hypothetical protein